ncbi:MAG TPA: type 4a pilus biogenesis protein PilO [Candidatus Portnoybacteria bacterium]|nr:type 4a pilus biogenesis protein PilO [Candidatus Portnoybacteria bacterium]HPM28570.1 type 4a pilus biogenesis protein PilO [Candidatus Portnoybacteria bacterium]
MIKNIIIAILGLGFIGIVIFLDIPAVQNILVIKKDIKTQQDLFDKKNEFVQTVEKLAEKYAGNENVFNQLNFILPDNQDEPNLIIQLEAIAHGSGIILNNIAITEGVKEEGKMSDYGIMNIGLKLNGNYESFKGFLSIVESNLRLIDINSIDFDARAKEEIDANFDFNVILKTYYQIN